MKDTSPTMSKTYQASSDYTVIDRAPLSLRVGQIVRLGKKDADWPGWIWATTEDGRGSYVPEDILVPADAGHARVQQAFQAHDLSVKKGDSITSLKEVKGWHWCKDFAGREGWLPAYLLTVALG